MIQSRLRADAHHKPRQVSADDARATVGVYFSMAANPLSSTSYYQIPEDEERTDGSCSIKHHFRCTPPVSSLLQLFVASSNILRRTK